MPLILAQVIPIPDASIPDSDIVTPAPTINVFVTIPEVTLAVDIVVTPAKTAPPFGSRVIASVDPDVSRSLLTLSVLIDILFSYLICGFWGVSLSEPGEVVLVIGV